MKSLTLYNNEQTSNQITTPFYLVSMGFDDILRLSTRGAYTYETHSYSANRHVQVSSISSDNVGEQKGTLTFEDSDSFISTYVLADGCAGRSVSIYQGYGDNPLNENIIQVFDGIMDSSTIVDNKVTINILSNIGSLYSTGLTIDSNVFNWLPPAGTVVSTGYTKITLNASAI